jgi:acetyl-CoA C-acetyltransferase
MATSRQHRPFADRMFNRKLNVNDGTSVLGHPIGATAAGLVVTLPRTLEALDLKRGIVALCIRGGLATAIAVTR